MLMKYLYRFLLFFLVTLFRVGFFYPQLTLKQLIQPQSWDFYPQLTLRQLIQADLESRFIVRSQLGSSIQLGSYPIADYRWSHNPPTYRRTVSPSWYRTHTVPNFDLQCSWIKSAWHYTRQTTHCTLVHVCNFNECSLICLPSLT